MALTMPRIETTISISINVNAFREEIERLEREPSAEVRRQQLSLLPKAGKNKTPVD